MSKHPTVLRRGYECPRKPWNEGENNDYIHYLFETGTVQIDPGGKGDGLLRVGRYQGPSDPDLIETIPNATEEITDWLQKDARHFCMPGEQIPAEWDPDLGVLQMRGHEWGLYRRAIAKSDIDFDASGTAAVWHEGVESTIVIPITHNWFDFGSIATDDRLIIKYFPDEEAWIVVGSLGSALTRFIVTTEIPPAPGDGSQVSGGQVQVITDNAGTPSGTDVPILSQYSGRIPVDVVGHMTKKGNDWELVTANCDPEIQPIVSPIETQTDGDTMQSGAGTVLIV